MPTQERLRRLYDYQDGLLISYRTGRPIGLYNSGYLRWNIDGKLLRVHRLIWVWHNGPIPSELFIDHIDRDRTNNRIENLRLVTSSENLKNRAPFARRNWGVKGLSWNSHLKQWRATAQHNRVTTYLGISKDPHSLVWLIHLYRLGIYKPGASVKREIQRSFTGGRQWVSGLSSKT